MKNLELENMSLLSGGFNDEFWQGACVGLAVGGFILSWVPTTAPVVWASRAAGLGGLACAV